MHFQEEMVHFSLKNKVLRSESVNKPFLDGRAFKFPLFIKLIVYIINI